MESVIEYLIVFIVVFIINYLISVRNKKKLDKKHVPTELLYLNKIYKINIKKINYRKFLWVYCFINTFVIATSYIIVELLVKGFVLQIIIGIVLMILLTIICYGLLGRYYLKKEGKNDV